VDFFSSALIGVFLGFVFGVGCALAVMYSIYMGGYRAAVKDAQLSPPPERLRAAQAKYALHPNPPGTHPGS
jgi:ABC-type antimicrobial peptide transport system permease subunit